MTEVIDSVGVSACSEDLLHQGFVSITCHQEEGVHAENVLLVDVDVMVEEELDDVQVTGTYKKGEER